MSVNPRSELEHRLAYLLNRDRQTRQTKRGRERARERETDRQTDRHRQTYIQIETDRYVNSGKE